MKVMFTLAALIVATLSAPAFANDWDMGSSNTLNAQQFTQAPAEYVAGTQTSSNGMQWDTQALNNQAAVTAANELAQYEAQQEQAAEARHNRRPWNVPPVNGKPNLALAQYGKLTPGGSYLPATSLSSFVVDAGGNADQIYGDEGTTDIPPFFGFDSSHTIDSGLNGGLTTGHPTGLPGAWTSY